MSYSKKLKIFAEFISHSKTKKIFYTLSDRENENKLRSIFFNVDLCIVSIADNLDTLKRIIKDATPSGNPHDDYTFEEFKLNDSEPIDNKLSSAWHLYVYEQHSKNIT